MTKPLVCVVILFVAGWLSAVEAADVRVGAAAANIPADDSMVIGGGIGPGKATGQEGELRAVAIVIEKSAATPRAAKWRSWPATCCSSSVTSSIEHSRGSKSRPAFPPSACWSTPRTRITPPPRPPYTATSARKCSSADWKTRSCKRSKRPTVGSTAATPRCSTSSAKRTPSGANSRVLLSDNTIWWTGSMDDAVRHTGPFDPATARAGLSRRATSKLRAVLFNHSTHTIGTRQPGVRSPSFYGLAAQELEASLAARWSFWRAPRARRTTSPRCRSTKPCGG